MRVNVQRIKDLIEEQGLDYVEKAYTIHTTCPSCGRPDKLSISKKGGAVICYRASCTFGRQWFENWLAETARISVPEAKQMILDDRVRNLAPSEMDFALDESDGEIGAKATRWPAESCVPLDLAGAARGVSYLESRGVPRQTAERYGVMYNPRTDRIVFPIVMDGTCYGWQGRAVGDVHKADRMRNNEGYSRGTTVMFYDRLRNSEHAIVCEGPFDAMKFDLAGGNVATMGLIVTPAQLQAIMGSGVKKVYLALDDDAMAQMIDLRNRIGDNVYRVQVPESARARCAAQGKKADFGECTFEECLQAFKNARPFTWLDIE